MQKFMVNRKRLGGFPTVVKTIVKSANHKQGYIKHCINEVDICERLIVYILVIFVLIYVHFLCFNEIFDFLCLVHMFDSMIASDRSLFKLFQFKHQQVKSC